MRRLSHDEIRSLAPSVFSEESHDRVSKKYRHIPTSEVLEGMEEAGFYPVLAAQTSGRNETRQVTNRHLLRFRHDDIKPNGAGETPEVCLYNSHNATSSYRLMFGIFRMVCSNGLIVMSEDMGTIDVRHIGGAVDTVIDESLALIKKAPRVFNIIEDWKDIPLSQKQQSGFSMLARAAKPGAIQLDGSSLLHACRPEDMPERDGSRSLWKTMNVVQENIIRGNGMYETVDNAIKSARPIKAINGDEYINRQIWQITEKFAKELV